MPKSGLKHIDVGAELTKTEWESEESHELIHGNSFPGSPVERQLFYRDDEHKWYIYNASSWVWLGGGGGGMAVHGNEYHDPDFEQQGVAASLIETHRTTAAHTQPQPPADHGNEKHDPDFEQQGVAASLVETHRTTATHTQPQPPAEHGNAAHDPDFATEAALSSHAGAATAVHGVGASTVESVSGSQAKVDAHKDLTTGVHGVGAAYIAKSGVAGLDLAAHGSRHGYLGADELPIIYLNAQRASPMINKHFGDLGGLTEGHSGGSLVLGIVFGLLRSGATSGNYGRVYMSQTCYHAYTSYGHTLGTKISIRQSTNQDFWLGWFESTTPGTNQNHYAFRITNNNLYAYAGKSDTYKENSGSLATFSGSRDFFLSLNDGSDANGIRFYVDHTLAYSVTNSANRPFGVNLYLVFYIKTNEAALKDCFQCPFTLFTAHNH
jgi:hypothetical protein